MRVYPIGCNAPVYHNRTSNVHRQNTFVSQPVSFKGHLEFVDYVAGAVGGAVMGAVGFAIAGPVGAAILGTFGAKTIAETNYESRPSNPNDD